MPELLWLMLKFIVYAFAACAATYFAGLAFAWALYTGGVWLMRRMRRG